MVKPKRPRSYRFIVSVIDTPVTGEPYLSVESIRGLLLDGLQAKFEAGLSIEYVQRVQDNE